MNYEIRFTKTAAKQFALCREAHLGSKVEELLDIIRENPFQTPPPCEKLKGMDDVYSQDLLYDPVTNIRMGCWYLRFIRGRVGDDPGTVAAAYNAGHGTVQGWLADPQYSEDGSTLKSIPYPETERYVNHVNEAFAQYQKLYPDCFDAESVED